MTVSYVEQLHSKIESFKVAADRAFGDEDFEIEELENLLNQADLAEAERDRIILKMLEANRDDRAFIDGKKAAIERDRQAIKVLEEQIESRRSALTALLQNVPSRKIVNAEKGINISLRKSGGVQKIEGLDSIKPEDLDCHYLKQTWTFNTEAIRGDLNLGRTVYPGLSLAPKADSLIIK